MIRNDIPKPKASNMHITSVGARTQDPKLQNSAKDFFECVSPGSTDSKKSMIKDTRRFLHTVSHLNGQKMSNQCMEHSSKEFLGPPLSEVLQFLVQLAHLCLTA